MPGNKSLLPTYLWFTIQPSITQRKSTRRKKTFSSRVNETEKTFKDSLGYPSNPLNPLSPSNLPNPLNPPSPSNPPSPLHPPNPCQHLLNPCFKDSRQVMKS